MIGGLIGCLLPFLPGPPLSFVALLIMQLRSDPPFTAKFLWIWAGITVVVSILDYVIPLYGIWGCTIGLIVGLFFPPLGLIIGPFAGAFVGELVGNSNTDQALKAAWGSFVGFLFGTLLKLVACLVMFYYLITSSW
jgi:uncharacterized protein YqgC (DUF456 family)